MSDEKLPSQAGARILVVDDALESLQFLTRLLDAAGYEVHPTANPELALADARTDPPDLALLDVQMPGMDGFTLCRLLKQDPAIPDFPILFISALQDVNKHLHGFEVGGVDFITKPIEERLVLARIETHLRLARTQQALEEQRKRLEQRVRERTRALQIELSRRKESEARLRKSEEERRLAASVFEHTNQGVIIMDASLRIIAVNRAFTELSGFHREELLGKNPCLWQVCQRNDAFQRAIHNALDTSGCWQGEILNRRKDGGTYPAWLTINSVYDEQGNRTHFIALYSDITSIKESQERLHFLAHHDSLTHLPNRLLFTARLEHAIHVADRQRTSVAVLALDLDNFKQVNDGLGHPIGDRVLQEVARRLQAQVRKSDTVARFGGDEFAVLIEDVRGPREAALLAQKFLSAFREPMEIEGHLLPIGLSIGICLYPGDGKEVTTLLKHADSALYRAKENGKDQYAFYTQDLTLAALHRLQMENDLLSALKNEELAVYYQPQFSLMDGRLTGIEALVRWHHPRQGCISSEQFLSLAEGNGLLVPIGNWVLEQACRQYQSWQAAGLAIGHLSVNLAGQQVRSKAFLKTIHEALARSGLASCHLELEITEQFIAQQAEMAHPVLQDLYKLGISLTVDDFGVGCSSLASLKRLPIRKLKLARTFAQEILRDEEAKTVARALVKLGSNLGLCTVVKGIENDEQRAFFTQAGCELAQGFLYSPPLPARQFERFLKGLSLQKAGYFWSQSPNLPRKARNKMVS